MNSFQRFSILTFPQHFDGTDLHFNVVLLPRDQNPLNPAIVNSPPVTDSTVAFADANFAFTAKVITGFGTSPLPQPLAVHPQFALSVTATPNKRGILEAMAKHMVIADVNMVNSNANLTNIPADRQPEKPRKFANSVKKYLPKTYRNAFNFNGPRNRNAVLDDSYHCAIKAGKFDPNFTPSTNVVSWGKVFAYLLRQPALARQAGMIFSGSVPVNANTFPDGGYLYIDLANTSDYKAQQNDDANFIKQYAARIPVLEPGVARQVFAPIQFPVQMVHQGNYDKLFKEAAEYDDGFCKIIHSFQPRHREFIQEDSDGNYPLKDSGVQLGWEDETILEWYIRQLAEDTSVGIGQRIDAPMGVFGYNIDVREVANTENAWNSLTQVSSKQPMILTRAPGDLNNPINLGPFTGELPFQVYPIQPDARKDANFWLPMYYGGWNGKSMVLPDQEAANIYQNQHPDLEEDPQRPALDKDGNSVTTGTNLKKGGAQNQLNQMYNAGPIAADLRYGGHYEFRVRMQDISGGSPGLGDEPVERTPSDSTRCRFKRYLTPNGLRIQELNPTAADANPNVNNDTPQELTELNIARPKLGYPSVVYTKKYADPIARLTAQSNLGITVNQNDLSENAEHRTGLGIADPDVDRVEVIVEIASLKMDKMASVSGKEDFVHLYTTMRNFPAVNTDDDYELQLNIPIIYRDVTVLHTGATVDVEADLQLNDDIDNLEEIFLPTGRTVRLTMRAVCEEKDDNDEYYGELHPGNRKMDIRYGEPVEMTCYKPSTVESDLLIQTPGVPALQGIFMRPDLELSFDGKIKSYLFGKNGDEQPENEQQLASLLKTDVSGLTLSGAKGERIVFGCSSRIRHTLAPDRSSITFASKGDLAGHWLACISLELDRDWMWDELETTSFLVKRTRKYTHDNQAESVDTLVGDIEMLRTAPFDALKNANRDKTRIIFIDAVEPTKDKPANASQPAFPDTIELDYKIEAQFKGNHQYTENLDIMLPITTAPAQVPKVVSAGLALSPYARAEDYSSSEVRNRYLWIEFEEPVADPQDTVFCRMLAVAPDQLLSNNLPQLLKAEKEPTLPIDPEYLRVIVDSSSNDLAGLSAMQPMQKSTTSDRHYILPIPPGLHPNADEMFGFFTYEFRMGHYKLPNEDDYVWTTSQGRFGRRLRVTGIQHPAPVLNCVTNRDEDKLWVTAPYAVAVHKGKNVTATPPRTELWALLYAQVKQADNLDHRNILLDDKALDWRVRIEPKRPTKPLTATLSSATATLQNNAAEEAILTEVGKLSLAKDLSYANYHKFFKVINFTKQNKNTTKYGSTLWTNKEVHFLLELMGLPEDSELSIIVVEVLPQITNVAEHISDLDKPHVAQAASNLVDRNEQQGFLAYAKKTGGKSQENRGPSPVDEALGSKRIYRTSKLTPVPDICCTDCE
ncbi:hypothetical protein Oweho_0729 [Owenweeksia hongkongensis DSM 17368]|uniref:Uncharacterized protein n=1 Tax=Owenweeksia hongkongensis (strain DSM 17368 / CIP 108786 / JCM 12287 / NRRL B-23963 / UST20020801) TaxID=926562 RepID=G8R1K3_OWEHD|nr:hypothetical protein [Owenweeksia hongkongensis]AEV31742.1 hypothetical protein Oweho_0729 [Owenweeksia hongkongensis DSM 17368]